MCVPGAVRYAPTAVLCIAAAATCAKHPGATQWQLHVFEQPFVEKIKCVAVAIPLAEWMQ